jgi:hypothetical protein
VCKLNRSIYGLRQSPRAWYARMDIYLRKRRLKHTFSDSNIYNYCKGSIITILVLYVNDLLITGSDQNHILSFKNVLSQEFEMKDLGLMKKSLGVQVTQTSKGILLHQTNYSHTIIKKYSHQTSYPTHIPLAPAFKLHKKTRAAPTDARDYQGLVGQLHYLTKTRPDIAYATSLLSRFMHGPQLLHRQAALNIVRYLSMFPSLGLWYLQGQDTTLQGFSDADYGGDLDDRISTSAYLFKLGPTPISWCSKKQSSTARSSCESEYRALSRCTCEAIWLRRLVKELGFGDSQPTTLWCNNQSSIKITKNHVFNDKTKHFEIDWHFIRQKVENGTIKVNFISTHAQPADILIKALNRTKFDTC